MSLGGSRLREISDEADADASYPVGRRSVEWKMIAWSLTAPTVGRFDAAIGTSLTIADYEMLSAAIDGSRLEASQVPRIGSGLVEDDVAIVTARSRGTRDRLRRLGERREASTFRFDRHAGNQSDRRSTSSRVGGLRSGGVRSKTPTQGRSRKFPQAGVLVRQEGIRRPARPSVGARRFRCGRRSAPGPLEPALTRTRFGPGRCTATSRQAHRQRDGYDAGPGAKDRYDWTSIRPSLDGHGIAPKTDSTAGINGHREGFPTAGKHTTPAAPPTSIGAIREWFRRRSVPVVADMLVPRRNGGFWVERRGPTPWLERRPTPVTKWPRVARTTASVVRVP